MSFKIHLIIVCIIIMVVYGIWQVTLHTAPQPVVQNEETTSSNAISIIHASWGLNCTFRPDVEETKDPYKAFATTTKPTDKLRPDNVLTAVSTLCNGKPQCSIPLVPEVLGEDPLPECNIKALEVEYRCFVYDRPWVVKSSVKQLDIDCSQKNNPQP